jgi:regulator of protease activity HflC (stomatin/prohibitin superfamily)
MVSKETKDLDNEQEDFELKPKHLGYLIFGIIAIIIFIILLFGLIYTIDAGDRGIILTFGKPSTEIMQPGIHIKIPIVQSLVVYSVRTQTISFDNKQGTGDNSEYSSLFAASKDLQDVQIATVVNYHINEKDVLNIYQQYGDSHTYQINILEPIIRNVVKATSAHYDANDLIGNRSEVVKEATQRLTEDFKDKNAVLDNLNIVNFQYSPQYSKAIEEKVTAQQNALTEQNKLVAVQFQAQQRIAQAKGEAEAIQIQVSAINQQGGANYVQLQAISKWNGQLPNFMMSGNGAIPFLDVSKAMNSS